MYIRRNGDLESDDYTYEQSLLLETETSLAIFSSCWDGGVDNIIREVWETFPKKHILAMAGSLSTPMRRSVPLVAVPGTWVSVRCY